MVCLCLCVCVLLVGHLDVVKLLVQERADLNTTTAEAMANMREHELGESSCFKMRRIVHVTKPPRQSRDCGASSTEVIANKYTVNK